MMLDTIEAYEDNMAETAAINHTAQELIQFMTDWGSLSGRRDAATLALMLSDDLIITTADSTVMNKAEYLDGFKNIPGDFTVTDYDQQAQIFDDQTAIVRARSVAAMGANVMHLRYTATFIKRGGKWDIIALHSSPLAM